MSSTKPGSGPGPGAGPVPAAIESNSMPAKPRTYTRASRACRRCRRLRTKCTTAGQQLPPCLPCRQAQEECVFTRRGEVDADRMFRQRPVRRTEASSPSRPCEQAMLAQRDERLAGEKEKDSLHNGYVGAAGDTPRVTASSTASYPGSTLVQQPSTPHSHLGWEALPPYDEVVQGVETMTSSFFQLGFVPTALFFEKLRQDRSTISVFLLLSILGISARFTPSLVRRYKGGAAATRTFLDRAASLVPEQMFSPSLEAIQGFFLMSIAEWGNGDKHRGSVYMGIAVRLAGIRRLHREETYALPEGATREEVVHSEEARRTFWMLETFENLHSGSDSPVAFSYSDITVLLPCHEHEFTFGTAPSIRAALAGTPPAIKDPQLVTLPSRSFFAVLLQTHNLWGKVARLVSADAGVASSSSGSREPRISDIEYNQLSRERDDFAASLPMQYHWSNWNLRGFRVEGLDLAYFSAVMVLSLSNTIIRRSYLQDILVSPPPHESNASATIEDQQQQQRKNEPCLAEAWPRVAEELFGEMLKLNEQIRAFFSYRSVDQGYPALIVFSVYVCGSLANHLRLQPRLCPTLAPQAVEILQYMIRGLSELQSAWPLARRWYHALVGASERSSSSSSSSSGEEAFRDGRAPMTPVSHDVHIPAAYDVQFNDPFPTDAMFSVFETYLGSDFRDVWGELF